MGSNNSYDDSSIDMLKGADRIRKRPATMLGDAGLRGARHGFSELYGNSLDEKAAGYGDRLIVKHYMDGSISIRDFGRGVPLGWNDKEGIKNWNWHVIYNELYGGGKYETHQDKLREIKDWNTFNPKDYNYLFSVGLNGLGAASTQYTSEFFEVESYRDGKCTSRSFRHGIPLVNGEEFDVFTKTQKEIEAVPEEIRDTDEPNGTFIHWKPDIHVFSDVNVGADWLLETSKDIAGVAGIDLDFEDEQTGTKLHIPASTLKQLLIDKCGNKLVTNDDDEPIIFSNEGFEHGITFVSNERQIYVCEYEIDIAVTKSNVDCNCYHNSVKMRGGKQYTGFYQAVDEFFKEVAKMNGVSIKSSDYEGLFTCCISTYSNIADFANQTKDEVQDIWLFELVRKTVKEMLSVEYAKGNPHIKGVVDKALEEARVREILKQQEKIIKQSESVKRVKEPDKFVSCDAYEKKNYAITELWITEGDSALGAVKEARDAKFQALYPIRGKGLNVLKASIDKILANKEIREIFALLGTGIDLNIKGEKTFNIDDLRFDKIVIATDADEDGYQIRVILFLIFLRLAPQLITEGHVYIAESPRFRILLSNGQVEYARNDAHRDEIIAKYNGAISSISRYKGLGEVNPEVLRETTVHPDTRNFIQLTCDMENDFERDFIDALFGQDKGSNRKSIITEYLGQEVADLLTENALILGEIDEDEDIEDTREIVEVQ